MQVGISSGTCGAGSTLCTACQHAQRLLAVSVGALSV